MSNSVHVSIDYFGVAGNAHVEALANQSSNNRARRLAFNALFKLGKASHLIAREARPLKVAIAVNPAGIPQLDFVYTLASDPSPTVKVVT